MKQKANSLRNNTFLFLVIKLSHTYKMKMNYNYYWTNLFYRKGSLFLQKFKYGLNSLFILLILIFLPHTQLSYPRKTPARNLLVWANSEAKMNLSSEGNELHKDYRLLVHATISNYTNSLFPFPTLAFQSEREHECVWLRERERKGEWV